MINNIFMTERTDQYGVGNLHHDGNEKHLFRELYLTHQAMQQVFSNNVGMPLARLGLLRLLAIEHPEGIGVLAIARKLNINAAAVTRQVQEMRKKGLVANKLDEDDARRYSVVLTGKGRDAFKSVHDKLHVFEHQLLDGLSNSAIQGALSVLSHLQAQIQKLK